MKYGYSMLIADIVPAGELDYHDCEEFLVVCPACKEGVFKGIRPTSSSKITHYLSHFNSTFETQECELRTHSLSREQLKTLGQTPSHGQSAEGLFDNFQNIFFECFTDKNYFDQSIDLRKKILDLYRNPNFNWLYNEYVRLIRIDDFYSLFRIVQDMLNTPIHFDNIINSKIKLLGLQKSINFRNKDKFFKRGNLFLEDLKHYVKTHHGQDILKFIMAVGVIMLLEPNLDNTVLWQEFSESLALVESSDKLETDKKYDNLSADNFKESEIFKADIGKTIQEFTNNMLYMTKMKFTLYVKKWWGKKDKSNLDKIRGFTEANQQTLIFFTQGCIILAPIILGKALIAMKPLMPSGRKYFNVR